MVDDRPNEFGSSPDANRSKRAPPTLDLPATEIPRPVEPAARVEEPDRDAQSPVEPPPVEEPAVAAAPDPQPDDARTEPDPPLAAESRRGGNAARLVTAALSGAAAAALVIGLSWLTNFPAGPLRVVSPPAAPANTAALDALTRRLASVEAKSAAPAPAPGGPDLTPRLDALDKEVASLRDNLAAVQTRADQGLAAIGEGRTAPRDAGTPAATPDLSAIEARMAQIEAASKAQAAAIAAAAQQGVAMQGAVAAVRAEAAKAAEARAASDKAADDKPLRRAIAASLLASQMRQGESYAAALATVKSLAADAAPLQPLEAFAAGVPTSEALSAELLALLPALAPSSAATGGVIDRLKSGAARLVRIERTDALPGDDRSAVIARVSAAARRNDVAAARLELNALPPADRAPVQAWIAKVDARAAALAAARKLVSDAMTALATPAQ